MSFNPSQQRAPEGTTVGGQWISAAAAKKAASKKAATAKKTAPSKPTTAKTSVPKLGAARNADAAKIQQDKQAQKLYQQMMGMDSSQRGIFLKKLPPDQLEKLTAILYSSPTSDKNIVAARIAVANEMTKRGIDIKKYGALGGGLRSGRTHPTGAHNPAHAHGAHAAAKRPAPSPAAQAAKAAALARSTSQAHGTFRTRAE